MKTLKVEDIISEDTSCLILYGTQLGNAQAIAEQLLDTATSEYFLNAKLFTLNELADIPGFATIRVPIVIVTSTTGDGDAPENADKFVRKLKRKLLKANTLAGVRYTILGLGDTNFNNFCNCPKTIHKRLQELGATLFYNPGWADDAVGLEEVVEPWVEDLWPSLQTAIEDAENKTPINGESPEKKSKSKSPVRKLFSRMLAKDKKVAATGGAIGASAINADVTNGSLAVPEGGNPGAVTLTLPMCPKLSLELDFKDKADVDSKVDLLKPLTPYPQIDGEPYTGVIADGRLLTTEHSVKTTVELTIRTDKPFEFEPGDAIGIVCPNSESEVKRLIDQLGLKEDADKVYTLSVKAESKGKIPAHIPQSSTVRQVLLWYCDVRTPPKKALLRLLAESCTDDADKNSLLELCSKQGSTLYEKHIRHPSTTLLDILLKFPSCKPSIAAIIEHLPRLTPRPYSISSSPLNASDRFAIAFNIIQFPTDDKDCDTEYRKYERLGVCTGWLAALGKRHFGADAGADALAQKFQLVSIGADEGAGDGACAGLDAQIVFYRRKNHNFRLPKSLEPSVVMVGPGTGVAPFIGFIQHRYCQKKGASDAKLGKMFLYFGCRHKEHDYLYGDDLKKFQDEGNLSGLYTSFSRDPVPEGETHYKYVQDMMWKNKEELVQLLLDECAYLYVCGDAKNMAKNVREKLIACIQDVKGLSEADAMTKIGELVTAKKYLQDVWT